MTSQEVIVTFKRLSDYWFEIYCECHLKNYDLKQLDMLWKCGNELECLVGCVDRFVNPRIESIRQEGCHD